MIKSLSVNLVQLVHSLGLLVFLSVLLLLFSQATLAQSPSPNVSPAPGEPQGVTYPISELGNCENKGACLTFCEDPVNYGSCVEYAKEKGFYEADPVQSADSDFWTRALVSLGCSSKEACLDFCSKAENHEKCDAYSKTEGVTGGYVQDPDKPEFLEKAKEILGCDSAQSCSSFCDDPANSQKCDDFADVVGLMGGQITIGPGGCNSQSTCDNFCRDPNNFASCASFAPPNGSFQGPGGCNNPESCRSHCEQNPDECRSYAPGSNGQYVPVACGPDQYFGPGGACTSNDKADEANSCARGGKYWSGQSCKDNPPPGINPTVGGAYFEPRSDMGNCKTPGECYDYCRANPGKCGGFNSDGPRPPDTYIPSLYYTPGTTVKHAPVAEMGNCTTPGSCYDFCSQNPGKCQGFDSKSPRPLDTYVPGTYYTPPTGYAYATPPFTNFYVTPSYYTPPPGSNYTTPTYYTPGIYSTPSYYTPPPGSDYTTPNYYTPGTYYATPAGTYPTPSYSTPSYYTPPPGSNYTTPTYYTPPTYTSPSYYTPPPGATYTTPSYHTPPAYNTPSYNSPSTGGTYTTPVYYTPPPGSNYTTPSYSTPASYTTPSYYTPPPGSTYTSPSYYTPSSYYTPGSYSYPTPSGGGSYSYPTPSGSYGSPSYPTPTGGYGYPSPSYGTPSYPTPSYSTPPPYGTPSYSTPSYNTPPPPPPEPPPPPPPSGQAGNVAGASSGQGLLQQLWNFLFSK